MIETARLRLRPFEERDRATLRAFWADPRMTAYLGGARSPEAADAVIARHTAWRAHSDLGFWVTETLTDDEFVGYCGLKPGAIGTPAEGAVEVGWALTPLRWGRGYALEAAQASLAWGWNHHGCSRIVAISAADNAPSRRVMGRLQMRFETRFRHPGYAADDPTGDSVLYAIDRP